MVVLVFDGPFPASRASHGTAAGLVADERTGVEAINDIVRRVIDWFVGVAAFAFRCRLKFRIRTYRWDQGRLRRQYRITEAVPVRGYDEETQRTIKDRYRRMKSGVFANTSGSTKGPKCIAYDARRVRRTRW